MARKRVAVKMLADRCSLFGESDWSAGVMQPNYTELYGTNRTIRERLRAECPQVPGVYGMLSSDGHVIYVGMSTSLAKRLQSYFASNNSRKKENRIRRKAVGVIWQPVANEVLARIRERELIRKFRPALNVMGQPVRMQTGYIIATTDAAACFQLVTEIPREHAGVWGPVPFNKFSLQAMEEFNLSYKLRNCPKQTVMQFSGEETQAPADPPSCFRIDLKTCLAPCVGECSRQEYQTSFNEAKSYLDGKTKQKLVSIEKLMQSAASDRKFETAAKLRDQLRAFEYLDRHLRRFHDWSHRANFAYRLKSEIGGQELWLIVVRGKIIDVVPRPVSASEKKTVTALIEQAKKQFSGRASQKNKSQPGQFVADRFLYHWFRKFPDEKKRKLTLNKALSLCNATLKEAS